MHVSDLSLISIDPKIVHVQFRIACNALPVAVTERLYDGFLAKVINRWILTVNAEPTEEEKLHAHYLAEEEAEWRQHYLELFMDLRDITDKLQPYHGEIVQQITQQSPHRLRLLFV